MTVLYILASILAVINIALCIMWPCFHRFGRWYRPHDLAQLRTCSKCGWTQRRNL